MRTESVLGRHRHHALNMQTHGCATPALSTACVCTASHKTRSTQSALGLPSYHIPKRICFLLMPELQQKCVSWLMRRRGSVPSKTATESPFEHLGAAVHSCTGCALQNSRAHHPQRQRVTGIPKSGFSPSRIKNETSADPESQQYQLCCPHPLLSCCLVCWQTLK